MLGVPLGYSQLHLLNLWGRSEIRGKEKSQPAPRERRGRRKEWGAERDLRLKEFPHVVPAYPPKLTALVQERKTVLSRDALWPQDSWTYAPPNSCFPFPYFMAKLQGPSFKEGPFLGQVQGVWLESQHLPFRVFTNSMSCQTFSSTTTPPPLCLFCLLANA